MLRTKVAIGILLAALLALFCVCASGAVDTDANPDMVTTEVDGAPSPVVVFEDLAVVTAAPPWLAAPSEGAENMLCFTRDRDDADSFCIVNYYDNRHGESPRELLLWMTHGDRGPTHRWIRG